MKRGLVLILATIATVISARGVVARSAASQVADHYVGRVLVSPDFSSGQVIGYYTFLEGIGGPLFSGAPSENTAFFTVRSDVFSLHPIQNGPLSATLVDQGDFTIYLNESPARNWSDLDSFSSGQPVATFRRSVAQLTNNGASGDVMFSASLEASVNFTFAGKVYNFERLVPNGVTHIFTASNTIVAGSSQFPFAFVLAGSDLAIGDRGPRDDETDQARQ
jgi:hypothetical protein